MRCVGGSAKAKIPFYVLDGRTYHRHSRGRPLMDEANRSFVGSFTVLPARHGMTMGELAQLFNGENSSAPISR